MIELLALDRACACPVKVPCVCVGGKGDRARIVAAWQVPADHSVAATTIDPFEAAPAAHAVATAPAAAAAPAAVTIPDEAPVKPRVVLAPAALSAAVTARPPSLSQEQCMPAPSPVDPLSVHNFQERAHETDVTQSSSLQPSGTSHQLPTADASQLTDHTTTSSTWAFSTLGNRIRQALGLVSDLRAVPGMRPRQGHWRTVVLGLHLPWPVEQQGWV